MINVTIEDVKFKNFDFENKPIDYLIDAVHLKFQGEEEDLLAPQYDLVVQAFEEEFLWSFIKSKNLLKEIETYKESFFQNNSTTREHFNLTDFQKRYLALVEHYKARIESVGYHLNKCQFSTGEKVWYDTGDNKLSATIQNDQPFSDGVFWYYSIECKGEKIDNVRNDKLVKRY